MRTVIQTVAFVALVACWIGGVAVARNGIVADVAHSKDMIELGRAQFEDRCAACHGSSGRGDGVVAELLRVAPTDLTRLKAKRGGTFPIEEIEAIVDGRKRVLAHGERVRPIWGKRIEESRIPSFLASIQR